MKRHSRKSARFATLCLVFALLLSLFAVPAFAASGRAFPSKPVTIIIPFSPGGAADQMIQAIRPFFREKFGVPLVCEYKTGGGGQVGWEILAASPSDGHTIGYLTTPHLQVTQIMQKAKYDMDTFVPLASHNIDLPILYTRKASKYETIQDVIADAKARPGKVKLGLATLISDLGLFAYNLQNAAGVEFALVPTNGGSQTLSGTLGGHFDVGIHRPSSAYSAKDELRGLAMLAEKREPSWPEVPTLKEALPELDVPIIGSWQGLIIKREVAEQHPDRYETLVKGFDEIFRSPEYQKIASQYMWELDLRDPKEFDEMLKKEYEFMKSAFAGMTQK